MASQTKNRPVSNKGQSPKVVTTASPISPSQVTDVTTNATSLISGKLLQYVFLFLSIIPVFIYFQTVNTYAVNFPYQDDYEAILEFLCKFKDANIGDKIALLFSQHGEHRVFHARVLYVLYHAIFGEINFVNIIWLGNLQYLGVFGLLVYFLKKAIPQLWYVGALFLSLAMFDLSNSENAYFAMASVTNYGVILLFFLSLFFFSKKTSLGLSLGLFFEALTIFSAGNGLIAAMFAVLYLVMMRENKKAIIAGALFLVCVGLHVLTKHPVPASGDSDTNLMKMATYFVHLTGGHFMFDAIYIYSIPLGIASCVFVATVLAYKPLVILKPEIAALTCITGFLLGSMASIAVFRSDMKVILYLSHSSRYLVYPHMLIAMMFVFLMAKVENQKVILPILSLGLVVMVANFRYNSLQGERSFELANMRLRNIPYLFAWGTPEGLKKGEQVAKESCAKGIYCIDKER